MKFIKFCLWSVGIFFCLLVAASVFNASQETAKREARANMTPQERRLAEIKDQFSPDGSHWNVEQAIKASMNDPRSYEHVSTKYLDKGDFIIVLTKFRGKNVYGGVVQNEVVAKVDLTGKVLQIEKAK